VKGGRDPRRGDDGRGVLPGRENERVVLSETLTVPRLWSLQRPLPGREIERVVGIPMRRGLGETGTCNEVERNQLQPPGQRGVWGGILRERDVMIRDDTQRAKAVRQREVSVVLSVLYGPVRAIVRLR